MIFRLNDNELHFPDPRFAEPDGLLAVGGEISPIWICYAYLHGIFPWYDYHLKEPRWYCPHQRFVIFPEKIHISHSMRKLIKQNTYSLTYNLAFEQVINNCATAQNRHLQDGAWLGQQLIDSFVQLNHAGLAKSIEVWKGKELVGGLYGIFDGMNFIGDSMFSLAPNASKLALIYLASLISKTKGIIDCQLETPHLKSMGGEYISYEQYLEYILEAKEKIISDDELIMG